VIFALSVVDVSAPLGQFSLQSLGERAHIALGSIHLRYMAKKGRFSVPASVNLR